MANDPMRILKADHREVEKLLDKLADSEEGAEREQMVEELVTKLSAHMEAEESIVYPSVKPTSARRTKRRPRSSMAWLARTREGPQMVEMPGFGAAVEMLKGGITHHVEEEEIELLPELKDSLKRDEWRQSVTSSWKRRRLRASRAATSTTQVNRAHEEQRQQLLEEEKPSSIHRKSGGPRCWSA